MSFQDESTRQRGMHVASYNRHVCQLHTNPALPLFVHGAQSSEGETLRLLLSVYLKYAWKIKSGFKRATEDNWQKSHTTRKTRSWIFLWVHARGKFSLQVTCEQSSLLQGDGKTSPKFTSGTSSQAQRWEHVQTAPQSSSAVHWEETEGLELDEHERAQSNQLVAQFARLPTQCCGGMFSPFQQFLRFKLYCFLLPCLQHDFKMNSSNLTVQGKQTLLLLQTLHDTLSTSTLVEV